MTNLETILLFAQNGKDAAGEGGGGPFSGLGMLLPLVVIFIMFYFLIIMPQRRRERQQREKLSTLKKNDRVVTNSGIIGVVSYIDDKDNEVTLRLEEGKVRVLKQAIMQILTDESAQDAEKKS